MERVLEVLSGMEANQQVFLNLIRDVNTGNARIEANQSAIMTYDQSSYARLQHTMMGVASSVSSLQHGQTHLHHLVANILEGMAETNGRVDALQDTMQNPSQDLPLAARVLEKIFEWAPKVASNWAPISAAIAATYKWGLPYLRQLLG